MTSLRPPARWCLLIALCWCCSACELLADFDRDKIPEPARDAAAPRDGGVVRRDAGGNPGGNRDAGSDAAVVFDASAGDEDAGR